MAGELRVNPSVHRAQGDRLVRARMLPVCDNDVYQYMYHLDYVRLNKSARNQYCL